MISKNRKIAVAGCSVALLGFISSFVLRIAGAGHGASLICHVFAFFGFAVALIAMLKEMKSRKGEGINSQQEN